MKRLVVFGVGIFVCLSASADIIRHRFEGDSGRYLAVEILDDDLIHFELSENNDGPNPESGIWVSPMIDRAGFGKYKGPKQHRRDGNTIETAEIELRVEENARCVRVTNRKQGVFLTRICGEHLKADTKSLNIERGQMTQAYGLGNLFRNPDTADGDWAGENWVGRNHGNFRFGYHRRPDGGEGHDDFHGGGPSVSQFPMLYAVGPQLGEAKFQNFGLLLDTIYRTSWDLRGANWKADTWGDQLRFFVSTGDTLRDLRLDYMELVGRPPIPPRSAFGLWISEFGYDNWNEVREDLESLKRNGFPVDGVALDLQWFGGGFGQPDVARMGSLRFNEANFPNPEKEVKKFLENYGVRFMPIEESYIDKRLPEYKSLKAEKFLATLDPERNNPAHVVERNIDRVAAEGEINWWGVGGLMDWSNPAAGAYWHKTKRVDLGMMGIFSHWLDLGEPEMYYQYAYYNGHPELKKHQHGDVHNLYNLYWAESISTGYADPENQRRLQEKHGLSAPPRHFTMSRAGTIGSHRYGAMWSGDVGRNMGNLRAHENTQMHMSLLGVDYYGSDAGGFLPAGKGHEPGHTDSELYTQWFANNTLTDVPVRPHGWALGEKENGNQFFTPDHKGHLESNRANILRRYELVPYMYSLAHVAYLYGEPVFPPLVYHFQGEIPAREQANLKMIGESLLMGIVAGFGQRSRSVYLPVGKWVDYESLDWFEGRGAPSPEITLRRDNRGGGEVFMPPLLAKAGAIIPMLDTSDATRNLSQHNGDSLKVRVFEASFASEFTLYEDDGLTIAYQRGKENVRRTKISQSPTQSAVEVKIGAAQGKYAGAPDHRRVQVELIVDGKRAHEVKRGDDVLAQCGNQADPRDCWKNAGRNRIWIDAGVQPVRDALKLKIQF